MVDQDLLGDDGKPGEFRLDHIAAVARHFHLIHAIDVGGGGILLSGQSVGRRNSDAWQRNAARLHRATDGATFRDNWGRRGRSRRRLGCGGSDGGRGRGSLRIGRGGSCCRRRGHRRGLSDLRARGCPKVTGTGQHRRANCQTTNQLYPIHSLHYTRSHSRRYLTRQINNPPQLSATNIGSGSPRRHFSPFQAQTAKTKRALRPSTPCKTGGYCGTTDGCGEASTGGRPCGCGAP